MGVELRSPDVAQPFATVRNRSRKVAMAVPMVSSAKGVTFAAMAVPMVSSAKGVTFAAFQRRIASLRIAAVALRDIPTSLLTCPKSSCVAGAILLPHL